MNGYEIKVASTGTPLLFLLIAAADHVTGLTGKASSVVVKISKNGGSYAAPAGAVTEIGSGLYQVAGNATDTNTIGPLWLNALDPASDPCDICHRVVAYDPAAAANLGLTNLDAAVSSRSTYAGGPVASVAAPVTAGTVTDKAGYSLATPPPTAGAIATAMWTDTTAGDFTVPGSPGKVVMGQLGGAFGAGTSVYTAAALANTPTGGGADPWSTALPGSYAPGTAGSILGGRLDVAVSTRAPGVTALSSADWTSARAANLDNLDAAISTRSIYAGGPVAAVTAPVTAGTITDKAGYALASSGLDAITATAPTGPAGTFPQMLVALWRRFYKRSVKDMTSTTIRTYADDGTTVLTTQGFTDDGAGNETLGAAS